MNRPNPDALLLNIKNEDAQRGKLKIFFGMCPGVGKTYAMLQEARQRQGDGLRVVIGIIYTHGRVETEALTQGLDRIPAKFVSYRDKSFEEMDIDEILKIRPQLVIVDELAHSNVPGSRHPKRYQDVLELLSAGIDVFTTLNVQHVESHREDIHAVTRIVVAETVPDTILDEAFEITLVDLSPQALRKRLAEGKVYVPDRARDAADNFFKTENLTALREMALRLTAAHVNRHLRSLMSARGVSGSYQSGERILVAVGATPYSESLIRMTRRWAGMLDASWVALHVESSLSLDDEEKDRVLKNLTLARVLGAEVVHKEGDDLARMIVDTAQKEHVTQIIVGKSPQNLWQHWLGKSTLTDRLVDLSDQIDVHVVRLSSSETGFPVKKALIVPQVKPMEYGLSLVMFAVATAVSFVLSPFTGYQTLGLVYLLVVALSGVFLGRSASFMLALLCALGWDYIFIAPKYTFIIHNHYDVAMLVMFFVVALVMGHITSKLRRQREIERRQRVRSEALYEVTRALAATVDLSQAMRVGTEQINMLCRSNSSVVMTSDAGEPVFDGVLGDQFQMTDEQKGLVHWVMANKKSAGRFSDTLPQQPLMYLPLLSSGIVRAVLVIKLADNARLDLAQRTLLESFTALMTLMLEKDELLRISREARMKEDTQKLQSALLDNLSHELKTPLTIIAGYLDALLLYHEWPKDALELLEEGRLASLRLTNSVDAVLDLTKLDTGNFKPNYALCDVKDVVSEAVKQAVIGSDVNRVKVECPKESLAVQIDFYMLTQALKNIISNALTHGPAQGDVDVKVNSLNQKVFINIIDQGGGIPKDILVKIFDKFYRGSQTKKGGLGLGLSISKRFVELNSGSIEAANLSPRGFMMSISLPVVDKEEKE